MISLLFLLTGFFQDPAGYVVMLKNGKVIRVQAPPQFEGRNCVFTTQDGTASAIPASMVDQEKTAQRNEEIQQQIEQVKLAKEEAEALARAEAEKARKEAETKVIKVGDTNALPTYADPGNNTLDEGNGEPAEGAVTGPSNTRLFNNDRNDPVFVKSEVSSRVGDNWQFILTVGCDAAQGVSNVNVSFTLVYADGSQTNAVRAVSPAKIAYQSEGTVTFEFPATQNWERSSYELTFQLGG